MELQQVGTPHRDDDGEDHDDLDLLHTRGLPTHDAALARAERFGCAVALCLTLGAVVGLVLVATDVLKNERSSSSSSRGPTDVMAATLVATFYTAAYAGADGATALRPLLAPTYALYAAPGCVAPYLPAHVCTSNTSSAYRAGAVAGMLRGVLGPAKRDLVLDAGGAVVEWRHHGGLDVHVVDTMTMRISRTVLMVDPGAASSEY